MKTRFRLISVLFALTLSGCSPYSMSVLQAKHIRAEHKERKQDAQPLIQTAVQYAPAAAQSRPMRAGASTPGNSNSPVGSLVQVVLESIDRPPPTSAAAPAGGAAVVPADANMMVTIMRQLPDGRLAVRGQKIVHPQHGNEYVQVDGIVRPQDITEERNVGSSKLLEVRLTSHGDDLTPQDAEVAKISQFFHW